MLYACSICSIGISAAPNASEVYGGNFLTPQEFANSITFYTYHIGQALLNAVFLIEQGSWQVYHHPMKGFHNTIQNRPRVFLTGGNLHPALLKNILMVL